MKRAAARTPNIKNKRVEEALYRLAVGHTIEEVRESTEEDGSGKTKIKTERIRKEVAPDLKAIFEWLRNRCPEVWAEAADQPPLIQLISAIPRPGDENETGYETGDNADENYD